MARFFWFLKTYGFLGILVLRNQFLYQRNPIRKLGDMIRFSIHLPTRYRLDLKLVKERAILEENPNKIDLGKVFRAKKGSKFSRLFKILFENHKVKKLVIGYIAIILYVSSFAPVKAERSEDQYVSAIIETPIVLDTEEGVQYPVDNISITQSYGFFHPGIDLDGITGDTIYPIMAGVVETVEYSKVGYGKSVIVSHGSLKSRYAHLSKINVEEGQNVTKSTVLGEMGATGRAHGDHLHLEVYENGRTINPLSILSR